MNAVDVGLQNAVESPDHLLDFGGRDVLAFPAEGVPDAIDEVEVAVLILAHQIAGAEPDVAFLKRVVQDLSVGLDLARIALEPLAGPRRILHDLADDLARLVDVALDAEALLVADRLLAFCVEADDLGREARGDPPGKPADRAFLAVEIEQRDVAFGRGVELDDLRNLEAPLELRPHIGPQTVAAGQAQMVRALLRVRRRVDEVAAELADILEAGAIPAHDIVPELAHGKFIADHHRAAPVQQRAGCDHAAGGVIEREAIVHAVAGTRVHDAGEGVAREHHAIVVHVRGLRQTGRARGVNVERAILDGEHGAVRGRERIAGNAVNLAIDARKVGIGVTMKPDLGSAGDLRARALQ